MKIILFANTSWYLYNNCLSLARSIQENGCEVTLLCPRGEYSQLLEESGFRVLSVPIQRHGINPFAEGLLLQRLKHIYKLEKPDIVHHFTLKCNIYGSFAARSFGVKRIINSITGLGFVFAGKQFFRRILQIIVKSLLRQSLIGTSVLFQNPDDQREFVHENIVNPVQCTLIRSSGVDLEKFNMQTEPEGIPLVILAGRLLVDKGIFEFVQAARLLKKKGIKARFIIVGLPDPQNLASIPEKTIKSWNDEKVIEWWRWQQNMPLIYQQANIVCLPSYREGVPKSLIEAAASGRPIITTDTQGCREVVKHNQNGLLVAPHSYQELAEAIQILVEDKKMRQRMGWEGRQIAEKNFNLRNVITSIRELYRIDQKSC